MSPRPTGRPWRDRRARGRCRRVRAELSMRVTAALAARQNFPDRPSCCSCSTRTRVTGDYQARQIALGTLRAMALGGIRDHVGGGFHRYSVDAEWRVPHFEKMLYDQAQLVLAYLDGAQASGDPFYAEVAEDTLDYVLREMSTPDGAFYSAEDADSVPPDASEHPPGPAGLPEARGRLLRLDGRGDRWSVWRRRAAGAPTDSASRTPETRRRIRRANSSDQNILYLAQSVEDVAARSGRSNRGRRRGVLDGARTTLFDGARPSSSSARRRQGDHGVERPDDCRLRARRAAARRQSQARRLAAGGRASGSGGPGPPVASRRSPAASPLPRSGRRSGGVLRRLRLPGVGSRRAVSDHRRRRAGSTWALDLIDTQTLLFRDERDGGWFSTTGEDRVGAAAPQGGLRRRRAGRGVGDRSEPDRPRAPDVAIRHSSTVRPARSSATVPASARWLA